MPTTTKVRPMGPPGTSGTTKSQQVIDVEGTLSNRNSCLIKVLTGICLGQVVMLTVTAASLGVFVSENVKQIEELKHETGTLQGDMARMQMNTAKGVLPGLSPTSDMESELSQFKANLQSLNERINTIETYKDTHTAATKETVDRITSVEKIIEEQLSTFANQSYIDTLDSPARSTDTESRLSQLESSQTSYQFGLQKLTTQTYTLQSVINANLTFLGDIIKAQGDTIVTLSNDIHQLETIIIGQNASIHDSYERLSLFDANTTEFQGDLQSQDLRLNQLEKLLYIDNITLQSHSSRIAAIEMDQINDRVVLLNQTKRIGQLESGFINITTVVISQDSKITKLQSDQIIDHDMILNNTIMNQLETYCNKNNATLLAQISRIEQLELNQSASLVVQANLTRKFNQIEKCSLHNNVTVQAHDSRISILESGLALNKDVIGNHTSRIIEIETGLASVNTTLQNLAASIEILESEQISNPSDQTDDPTLMKDFLDYLIADVIPFQTILKNTRRIEKLENSTSDQDASDQDFIFNCTRGFNEVETNLANLNATLQNVITRIVTLESEQTSNPPGEITDPDMVRDLLGNLIEYLQDVIPFQTISNNTKRIEQLEYNTVDQDTTIIGLALEVNKTWNVIQDYSARSGNSTGVKSGFSVNTPISGIAPDRIKFDRVVTNIGGHYDTFTGIFACHIPGYYYFILHVFKDEGDRWAYCNIRRNEEEAVFVETNVAEESKNSNFGTSNSVIFHLDINDTVALTDCTPIDSFRLEDSQTSFIGFLLYAD